VEASVSKTGLEPPKAALAAHAQQPHSAPWPRFEGKTKHSFALREKKSSLFIFFLSLFQFLKKVCCTRVGSNIHSLTCII